MGKSGLGLSLMAAPCCTSPSPRQRPGDLIRAMVAAHRAQGQDRDAAWLEQWLQGLLCGHWHRARMASYTICERTFDRTVHSKQNQPKPPRPTNTGGSKSGLELRS